MNTMSVQQVAAVSDLSLMSLAVSLEEMIIPLLPGIWRMNACCNARIALSNKDK